MTEKVVLTSMSAAETEKIGEDIGSRLRGGEVIELMSDLGGGKTTLTRGLVRGTSSTDHVSSPTFTVSKVYEAPAFSIYHFDFYRLDDPGLIEHEIHDLLNDKSVVLVIEWGELVQHVLPTDRMTIEIQQIDAESRELHISYANKLNYLMEAA